MTLSTIYDALRDAAKARPEPRAAPHPVPERAAAVAPATNAGPRRAPGDDPRVLVVEDDEACRRGICRNLRLAGYAVLDAADGMQALDLLEEHGADVIVTDLRMPNMDGVGLILSLALGTPRVPIIAVTGIADHDRCIDDARRFGATSVLRKPFDSQALVQAIADALEG